MGIFGRNLQYYLSVRGTYLVVGPSVRESFFLGKVGVKNGLGGILDLWLREIRLRIFLSICSQLVEFLELWNTFDIPLKTSVIAIILGC